jgi:hypothetical protein
LTKTHPLAQQVDYLRAALEQEKKPIGILLGAGAPMSIRIGEQPLVPGLEALTAFVLSDVSEDYRTAIEALVSHLDESERRNLEAILNYVRAIATLPGALPVRGIEKATLEALDSAICRVVRERVNVDLPQNDNPYLSLALWIRAVRRLTPTQVFTTNYDLLMEQAFERHRVAYFDGFMGSHEPIFDLEAIEEDDLPSRWTLLWKLHGSINWSQDESGNVIRRPAKIDDKYSALVYPSHLKYDQSRRLPYLAMMDRLKVFLRKPGAILVSCGFSYRDQHINEVIDQSLRANPTASVHAMLYGPLDDYPEAAKMASGLHNLVLLAQDSAIIGGSRGAWAARDDEAGEEARTCDLGDFVAFGAFLQGLTGDSAHIEVEVQDHG